MIFELLSSFYVFCLFFSLFSKTPISLMLLMLFISLVLSLLLTFQYISWYGLIFFLVFMSGLLVLVFYILSLSFNPKMVNWEGVSFLNFFLVSGFLFLGVDFSFGLNFKKKFSNFSLNLFKSSEMWFKVGVILFLLMVLWLMKKMIFKIQGVLRPLI